MNPAPTFKAPNQVYLSDLTQEDINHDLTNILNFLRDIQVPLISFFGSARVRQNHPYARKAEQLAYALGKNGYGILTGGGPGIMQAANTGAHNAGAVSIGLRAQVLTKERIDEKIFTHEIDVKYLLIRRFAMSMRSHTYVFFPGGFGTMNEIFEYLMLIQVGLYEKVPFILIGKEFYKPLMKFLEQSLVKEEMIDKADIRLFTQEDSVDKIIQTIQEFKGVHASKSNELPLWSWHIP
jgi:hypothetical protein